MPPMSSYASSSRHGGKGKTALGGVGLGMGLKRHKKILRDNINGIKSVRILTAGAAKPAIRRLARRGGVKRISATIYPDIRGVVKDRLGLILKDCCAIVDYQNRKTVTTRDIIFTLRRLGNPIYGFDPDTINARK